MRSSKRSSRGSRSSRSKRPAWQKFLARFQQRSASRKQTQRKTWKRLRQWWERRRRSKPRRRPQPSFNWKGFRRKLSRRLPRVQWSHWSLNNLINPAAGGQISTPRAAALVLRGADYALLQFTAISLVLNALPLRLSGPQWYLQLLNGIAESTPVLVLALLLGLLSLGIGSSDAAATLFHRKLLRLSRVFYVVALLLLPLQLGLTAWLFGQAYDTDRAQLAAIRANADALITGAQQQTSKEAFLDYLQSRNMTGNLEAIQAAPLVAVRSEFIQSIEANRKQQEQSLASATRSTLLRYGVSSVKLLATLLVFVAFLRLFLGLVKRSLLQRTTPAAPPSDAPAPDPSDGSTLD